MLKHHCRECGGKMQRWGYSPQNKPRFFCRVCKKTTVLKRIDAHRRRDLNELREWLVGKESLTRIAGKSHLTRQALWKRFHKIMGTAGNAPHIPNLTKTRILIADGTYVHGHTLCALIAVDEQDHLYWKFAPYESYQAWVDFLSSFTEPEIIVMDGQKGLFAAAKTLWPKVPVQRCQFHLIAFAMQYLGRRPQEKVGQTLMHILYDLKYAKTHEEKEKWLRSYLAWEKKYEKFLGAKDAYGRFHRPRLRSTRLIIRRALPYLFTFLDHRDAPNTTNLVEGWINGALAESLRLHRGLHVDEKKVLVTILLSQLTRGKEEREAKERLRKKRRAQRTLVFIKKYFKKKAAEKANGPGFPSTR